jgi:TonB-linked SusC/RagA family outer membrane protein
MKKNYCSVTLPPGDWQKAFKALFLLWAGILLLSSVSFAQPVNTPALKGNVTDETGQPVSGVSVNLKGTALNTQTNDKGDYSLNTSVTSGTLVFSYVGKKTEEVAFEGNTIINVMLQGDVKSLEEYVAIGYGVAKKKDLTGSVSNIDGAELANRNATQISQALQGTMPGVMVTRTNTLPGASASILVRGVTTIGNSAPLVIVDGVPVNSLDDVNADDVQDISVLKDAASASIYGARAAAGVILVTTKRPRTGQQSFEYTANLGFEKATQFPEVVGVKRYLEMINEFTWNDAGNAPGGEYALYTQDDVENWLEYNKTNPNRYPVTDWRNLLMNKTAPRQSHYFSFSSGTDKVKTQASINYESADALYDYFNFERVMTRLNNTFNFNKYITAQFDIAYNYSMTKQPVLNPIWDAQRYAPIYAATWADGRVAEGKNGSNAYAELHYGGFDNRWQNKFTGRASLQFKPVEGLTITGVFSPYFASTKAKRFVKQIKVFAADDPTQFTGFIAGNQATYLSEARNDAKTFTKQLLANYQKKFGFHRVNVLAGYEDFYSFNENLGAKASNYTLSNFPYLDLGPLDYMNNTGDASETAYRSYFGRLMYDYDNKYFLQANIRYDGSSRFHPDYRWGSFPSVSAGWTVSEEKFMDNNRIFSHLKLRAAWGQLGNERIGDYPYQSSIGYSNALFYQGNTAVSAITAAQFAYAIRDITWEITETTNFGVDASFLNNRLSVSGEVFRKKTKDMLLELEIPDYMGFENPQQNTGKMFTNGWDFQLGWRDRYRGLKYSFVFNLSDSRSKMGDLGGIVLDGAKIIRMGSEYNEWFGYISDGIFQTQEEVNGSPKLYSSVKPGDIKYRDISGPNGVPDGKITPDYDRVPLGGSLPRFLYSGMLNAEYKGFDLALAFQGVGKQTSRLTPEMVKPFFSAWTNAPAIIDGNYWSVYNSKEQNEQVRYPRLSYTAAENNNYVNSDFWLVNGAYFRLKNVMLGYSIPQRLSRKAKLNNVRLFASVTDLFSINHLPKGWDPESTYSTYISSSYNFGVTIKF